MTFSSAHHFPTNGMGVVLGITRRRASDVGEPVGSLTRQELATIHQRLLEMGDWPVCPCGEPVAFARSTYCSKGCWALYNGTGARKRKALAQHYALQEATA